VGLRRRSAPHAQSTEKFGDIEIDLRGRTVSKAGRNVPVTRKEFEILALLARRQGEVIPRDEFCDLIWGVDVFITQRVIDTHIASLRKKIEADPNSPQHILSVRGVGYKLE
jgi:DNA-binding response OmpR family regulator